MYDLVIGKGEVGSAVGANIKKSGRKIIYHDPDKKIIAKKQKIDTLNICFPYSNQFVDIVKKAIDNYEPNLTIIHSTVRVGTTRKIGDVAYSFVRGRHPDITEQIVIYCKHVGALNKKTLNSAIKYLKLVGFAKIQKHKDPETVEFGKLYDTTYFGVVVAWAKSAKHMADFYGIDWNDIKKIDQSYNVGVIETKQPHFVRPILEPMPGPIGGHCVVPNAKILQLDFKDLLLDAIINSK